MRSAASLLLPTLPLDCAAVAASTCFSTSALEFVDALADFALGFFRRGLQPEIVDLRENAVLARQPAIAEGFPVGFALDGRGFLLQRRQQLLDGVVERRRGEVSSVWERCT